MTTTSQDNPEPLAKSVDNIGDNIAKPSLQRLALMSGVKTMSNGCISVLRGLLLTEVDEICKKMRILNHHRGTTTIMVEDLENCLKTQGYRIASSDSLGESTCAAT